MYKNPSITLLKFKLNIDLVDGLYDKTVGSIFYEMVNQTNKENASFKHIFGLCKLSVEDVLGYKSDLDTQRDENNGIPYSDIYNGVLSDTNKLVPFPTIDNGIKLLLLNSKTNFSCS